MSDSFATPRTAALQALLSMGFFRQKYWSGLLCPPPGHLPDPGIEHASIPSPALTGRFFTTSATWEVQVKSLSHVRLFPMPWTVAHQASPSMGFSRKEYWTGLPFPSFRESSRPRDQRRWGWGRQGKQIHSLTYKGQEMLNPPESGLGNSPLPYTASHPLGRRPPSPSLEGLCRGSLAATEGACYGTQPAAPAATPPSLCPKRTMKKA